MRLSKEHVLKRAPLKKVVKLERLKINKSEEIIPKVSNKSRKYILSFVSGLFVGILILTLVSLKYSFINVTLAGHKIDQNSDIAQLSDTLQNQIDGYSIVVDTNGKQKFYDLEKTGVSVDIESSINDALEAKNPNNIFLRLAFWRKEELTLNLISDQEKLEKFSQKYLTKTVKKPRNATVTIKNGSSKVIAEKDGSAFSLADSQATLYSHISRLDTQVMTLTKQEKPATITKTEAVKAKKTVDSILSKSIVFHIEDNRITASPTAIGAWIDIEPAPSAKSIDVSINSGKILDYLNEIASPYVSPPQNAILLPGNQSKVLIPGKNGVDIVDKEKVSSTVAKQIVVKDSINQTLPVAYQSYKTIRATAHNKWLAVDLSSKVMYAYEKTKLVRSFLISGGAPETPTVEGTYKIFSKVAKQDMRGANADGSRYFQPDVQWVNYFYADYAIHGNYWRPTSYFGNINASHGCVGLPNSEASWVYDWAPIGTTVITFS